MLIYYFIKIKLVFKLDDFNKVTDIKDSIQKTERINFKRHQRRDM